jgi:hypothetical protein
VTRRQISVAACLLIALCGDASAQADTASEIRASFDSYRAAVRLGDWVAAADLVDAEAVAVFERVRDAALHADKADLLRGEFWISAAALVLRHVASADEIEMARGRAAYALASRASPFPPVDPGVIDVGPIHIGNGDAGATAPIIHHGQRTDYVMRFVHEDGRWRIAWSPLFANATVEFETQLGITPRTPADVRAIVIERDMFPILRDRTRRDVSQSIWQPLKARR